MYEKKMNTITLGFLRRYYRGVSSSSLVLRAEGYRVLPGAVSYSWFMWILDVHQILGTSLNGY